jgi:cell division protein FtsB
MDKPASSPLQSRGQIVGDSLAFQPLRWLRAIAPPLLFLGVAALAGWSATQGDRGTNAYADRLAMLAKVEADNARAVAELARWRNRVIALRGGNPDLDLLDERGRSMLHLADPADIVVPYPESRKLF